ncbi:hypothetical protein K470DRAFT_258278 [Piedraia hortae CBS 480.64]|uniref:WW-domain-binding protein n=1 Tax=Piedraia hortae CBS 480.64 TaxID=1314780 RepID=A0A6A7BYR7_9PEZI|nr:hypothetical protein K470DRAFT_258278 [Piedraia hortae CBS 480.64]
MQQPTAALPFAPLPQEQLRFTSKPRVSLSLSTPAHFPGRQQQAFNITASGGKVYLTNRRLVYLPDKPKDGFQNFAAPIMSVHDSRITSTIFGPNSWTAVVEPVAGGGIPVPPSGVVELKLTFKDGGVFDFQTELELIKERLHLAADLGPEAEFEDLPAYQEHGGPLPHMEDGARPEQMFSPPLDPPPGYEDTRMQT